MTRLVVVQARTGSTRLPGKTMMELAGRPLLSLMMERLSRARRADAIVIATTDSPEDDCIAALCEADGWPCFRGHATDLLDRHYQCARAYGATIVAKVPSDVPLMDPALVDQAFDLFDQGTFDYVSNLHPPTFPDGLDVEVFGIEALATAWREATRDFEREHTTPFLWDRPSRFRVGNIATPDGIDYSLRYRWTIDYAEDYALLQRLVGDLYPRNPAFTWTDVVAHLEAYPSLAELNANRVGVVWQQKHLHELTHVEAAWIGRDQE